MNAAQHMIIDELKIHVSSNVFHSLSKKDQENVQ